MMSSCWVVVKFSSNWYPGETVTIEEEEIEVKWIKRAGIENQFLWAEIEISGKISAGLRWIVLFV